MKIFILFLTILSFTSFGQSTISEKEFKKKKKEFLKTKDYVYIPSKTFKINQSDQDVPYEEPIRGGEVRLDSFFMHKYEMSNWEYLLYIDYLEKTHPELVAAAMPDTLVWRTPLGYNEPYVDYYLRHPAYRFYPVVGVSYNQAVNYCKWATESYNQYPDRVFKKVLIRLPTEEEWEYAARGGNDFHNFPWSGFSIFDDEHNLRANFRYIAQTGIHYDSLYKYNDKKDTLEKRNVLVGSGWRYYPEDGDWSYATSPVDAYHPNGFGLYNMAGNVEEMVVRTCGGQERVNMMVDCQPVKEGEPGITHGGSWLDPGAYMDINVRQFYPDEDYCSSEMGFRIVLQVIEY